MKWADKSFTAAFAIAALRLERVLSLRVNFSNCQYKWKQIYNNNNNNKTAQCARFTIIPFRYVFFSSFFSFFFSFIFFFCEYYLTLLYFSQWTQSYIVCIVFLCSATLSMAAIRLCLARARYCRRGILHWLTEQHWGAQYTISFSFRFFLLRFPASAWECSVVSPQCPSTVSPSAFLSPS